MSAPPTSVVVPPPLPPAEYPPDYSRLWYSDPTGAEAVRNLTAGTYTITGPHGFVIHIDRDDLRPILGAYDFAQSRTGRIWGRPRKKLPEAATTESQSPATPHHYAGGNK